jgi:HAD superfamily hydrolase (TIGR01509 family)
MFDLIIFDCDGTLTDSEKANNQATLDVLADIGIHYTMDHALKNWVGTTLTSIMLSVQMETGQTLPDDIIARCVRRTAELQGDGMAPVDGAPELVAAAKEKFPICVASNGERSNVIGSLKLCGLLGYFHEDHIFTKIQVKNPKPYPDLFLFAAAQMGFNPERCLVIEDSGAGVRAGVAAGMTTWGFSGSSHNPAKQAETLKAAGAHQVFDRLIHIKEKLGL